MRILNSKRPHTEHTEKHGAHGGRYKFSYIFINLRGNSEENEKITNNNPVNSVNSVNSVPPCEELGIKTLMVKSAVTQTKRPARIRYRLSRCR